MAFLLIKANYLLLLSYKSTDKGGADVFDIRVRGNVPPMPQKRVNVLFF